MSGSGSTFLDDIAFGRHVEGDGPLHRAWPPVKAVVFSVVAVSVFFMHSATGFLVLGLLLTILAWRSRIPQSMLWRSLRPVYPLVFFTILAWSTVNHPDGSILDPAFSWDGLLTGGLYGARLVLVTLLTTVFLLTTRPGDAVSLGITLLSPFKLLGVDRHELSLLVHLAYRFVPLLRREVREVRQGRRARNLPPPRSLSARTREAIDSLVFLFVGALHRAETTSYALEDRKVLELWQHQGGRKADYGLGGWPHLAMLACTALLLWKDPLLL